MKWQNSPGTAGLWSVLLAVVVLAAIGPQGGVAGQVFRDDFEAYAPGSFPAGSWHDVFERVGNPSVPPPTATIIETIDAHGAPTRALQTARAFRSASGAFSLIDPANTHQMSIDVRIDGFAAPNQGWPIGVGYIQDVGFSDVNENPQNLVYAWTDRRWHLFVSQGVDRPAIDVLINSPPIVVGRWYTISIGVDTQNGFVSATVSDAASGSVLGSLSGSVPSWDPARGAYDAITMFDGESPGATTAGQATVDNVRYLPEPSSAALLILLMATAARWSWVASR